MSLALLKKKSNTQKISQDFSQQLSWKIFTNSHLSPPLTSLFYLPLLICHINRCEMFCQFFCVYTLQTFKKKKILDGSFLISNFASNKRIEFK